NIQTSKTIQGGLARTTRTPYKPFSFQTPKLGVSSKAVMGLGLGSRGIISGFSGSKIGAGVTSLKTTGLISGSAIASLSGTASSLTGGGIVSTITTGVIGGGGVIGGIGTGLKLPPFNLPKPSLGTPGGIGKIGAERFFKYTPSFAALKFGITSTKKTKGIIIGGREVYSGLTTRAIVKKRKIKKKTKKKSK
ncbi:hypothetical protein KAU11_10040, partial [Candidatus Babeliales bacterium]|nr:hypothetical protein [Candidatus Babeliales bacterium]